MARPKKVQRRRRRSRSKRRTTGPRRAWRWLALGLAALLLGYAVYLDFRVRHEFEGKRWSLPARVFARPLELYAGRVLSPGDLQRELQLLHYRRVADPREPGTYRLDGDVMRVQTRGFRFAEDGEPERRLELRFRDGTIESLRDLGANVAPTLVRVEPLLIANIYPQHNEDRVLVRLEDVPPLLVDALLATEDRKFFEHHGLDLQAIARALYANLRAGRTVQGGSTLTQQLVKNFYLSSERTLWRKANEAVMALLLEWHYGKEEILEAYLNEIYLGQDGQRSINGFGLAGQFYFERRLDELEPEQIALLVALVRGASYYDPRRYPQRAEARRDRVLDQLSGQGLLSERAAEAAKAKPLAVVERRPSGVSPFPAYLDLVRRQLRRDYREEDLRSEGLFIFTNFDPLVQLEAERALESRLRALEAGDGREPGQLQGAVVVASLEQGEVLALIGGRELRFAGFNRALDARRPIGSLVKPAVYLAALAESSRYTLMTRVDDGPLRVEQRGSEPWEPQNYDREHHGEVTLLEALVQSYNVSTARLGLSVGLERVVQVLKRLGAESEIRAFPALLLGAVELSPLEITQIYQTLGARGYRAPLRAIREVKDRMGETLQRYSLDVYRAVDPDAAYLVDAALHQVTINGTGAALSTLLPEGLQVAGKTGTTDELRDSWFAGFSGEHVAVVWLGRDDNGPIGLTGASGALPIWGKLVGGMVSAPLRPAVTDGVEWVIIDPESGLRAEAHCDGAQSVPFIRGSAPEEWAPCAQGVGGAVQRTFKWFQELFE
ncbi:MAG: penicillin-binding protein 1B [Thiohalocapsa sp.]|jgi:penicillin-binding protein 1B